MANLLVIFEYSIPMRGAMAISLYCSLVLFADISFYIILNFSSSAIDKTKSNCHQTHVMQ